MTNEERDRLIIELHTMAKTTEKHISTLFKAIEGNGQPGLKQEVAGLKRSQMECLERQRQAPANYGNKIAIGAVLVAVFISPLISAIASFVIKKSFGA